MTDDRKVVIRMRVKSLIVTDDIGNFENVQMVAAESNVQKEFPDYKVWKVTDHDGVVYYVNSLYISSFELENKNRASNYPTSR